MGNKIIIQIGKIRILLKGDEMIIRCLEKYYCDFMITESADVHYTIDIRVSGYENDIGKERYSVNTYKRSEFYIPNRDNYVNIVIDHDKKYCNVKLLRDFSWKYDWADWEFSFRLCAFLLFMKNEQIIVHAAGLLYQGKVYLITGESGAGKTTTAKNCINENKQITILNDDTIILYKDPTNNNVIACSAPYQSTSGLHPVNGCGEFAGIYRVMKSDKLCLEPMSIAHAIQQIWTHSFSVGNFLKDYKEIYRKFYGFCKDIAQNNQNFYLYTPFKPEGLWELICTKGEGNYE